jgi:hypothetical protein
MKKRDGILRLKYRLEERFEFERTRTVWNIIPAIIVWTTFRQIEISWLCYSIYFRYKNK